ncbi:MAG: amidohydrolase family protein [Dehalococcoidia bacterium]
MPKAIDIHIHPPNEPGTPEDRFTQAMAEYFKSPTEVVTREGLAEMYQELDMMAVVLASDARSAQGDAFDSNDWVASFAQKYPDTFIAFGSVDPWRGKMAVKEIERAAKELGVRGIKFLPMTQEFYPNEHRFYPLYEKMVELGLIAMFHTGTTAVGARLPGGGGVHLKYTRPIPYIDDIAADFPELTIIMAHPAFPWQEEQLAVMVHKPNVYMDISGWSPKYFSPLLIQYANTLLQDKVMFGSDYPGLTPQRWLKDFEAAPFRDEVRPKILLENAKRVLKL